MNRLLWFSLGAVIGSLATWYVTKSKYEQIMDDEIESVKETFSEKKNAELSEFVTDLKSHFEKPDLMSYTKTIMSQNYAPVEDKSSGVYVIAPIEFGEFPDYNRVSLYYYTTDDVITNENGDVLDEEDSSIAVEDFIDHFGEYESDSVYIRDDMRCCDYEILKVEGSFGNKEVQ